ncbi:MAG TPA: DnaJ domain-containing protein [Thermoanaerobaculia bacterium]|nr:DnaJ domain-containing protein [Thermoanaerobaculia bacterium]HUM29470.1 DnaJ domain-containing protein [Thermoanaerobaculia bacterium]HXK67853.1 DnaJ domain-containing protein [Thermoanaerobaculia bacterium]
MASSVIALGLKPQDLPAALRQSSLRFHPNVRSVDEQPFAVLTSIVELDESNTEVLKSWRKSGTRIIDYTDQDRKSPLADIVISTKWDDVVKIMRFSEAVHLFNPRDSKVRAADQGTITHVDLGRFIIKTQRLKLNGILICKEEFREHRFHFQRGILFLITTNIDGEHLGSYLVQKGKITPNQFQAATRLFFSSGKRIGHCLVAVGALSAEGLNSALLEHQEFLGSTTFDWNGTWEFFPVESKLSKDLTFPVHVPRMVLHSVNLVKEFEPPSPLPWKDTDLVQSTVPDIQTLPLTPDQYYLLDQIQDKQLEVRHLYSLLPPPEKQKDRTICQLYISGVLRIFTFDPIDEVVERAEKAKKQTCYEILDLTLQASQDDIRKKYYEFARKYHPDRFTGSERYPIVKDMVEMYFAAINQAYQILFDPEERKAYDLKINRMADPTLRPEDKVMAIMRDVRKAIADSHLSQAIQKLNEVLYLGGKTAETYRLLGQCLMQDSKRLKEAEANLLQSLNLDPANADVHFMLAKLYLRAGMKSRAIRHLQETVKIQPGHFEAENLLKELHG